MRTEGDAQSLNPRYDKTKVLSIENLIETGALAVLDLNSQDKAEEKLSVVSSVVEMAEEVSVFLPGRAYMPHTC